ncbi:exo-beta-D-glucosaminidase [Thermococcus radiotolerans]|uniref:Beta-galactosidase n=1 Tax=Thermococcus radiotolerans TaxID=187880 RepID=A0A2Z2MZJ6_9EURY|nr:exo-beta-D-glucosaminidase [Thermococcus radiotolerans]ASJ15245.1 beta-galactosidase [Thermococcus radiotolerans]
MKVGHDGRVYLIDGERVVIYGGTLQFFRVPRRHWRDRLEKMKRHGLNTVDTYVAWNWHEPAKGNLDFTGETSPERDLVGFLELVQEMEMYAIVRPGPYICGEWRNGGIPNWLINEHPEILARGPDGDLPRDIYYPPITYLHPTYLEAVSEWYDAVLPVIQDYLHTNGGPIISVSIDDEPSYWETIFQPFLTDYNDVVVKPGGFWEGWLRENYSLETLAERYGEEISDYGEVKPPTDPSEPLTKLLDWHRFKIWMTNRYVETLYDHLRRYVDVPISILDPYLLLVAWKHFYRHVRERNLDIHLWTEFWYSFYRSFDFKEDRLGHIYYKTGIYRFYQKKLGTPPLSIETQVSLAHTIEPDEAELLYALLPALGIHNINYYLYAGGENPEGYESHNGISWDVYSPIGLDGTERPHVEPIKWLGEFLRGNPGFVESRLKPRVAFGGYEPYEPLAVWGLRGNLKESVNLNEYLFGERGLLTLLAMSNVPFDVLDLEEATVEEMLAYDQLWVYSLDFMAKDVQNKLVEFVERGGNLVVLPMLPYLDENMKPYSALADYLGVEVEFAEARDNFRLIPFVSVSSDGIDRMVTRNVAREVRGGTPVAFANGKPVGALVRKGRGSAIVLGFRLQYFSSHHDLHRKFVDKLLALQGVTRDFEVTDSDMIAIPRGNYLVLANPRGHRVFGKVRYRGIEVPKLMDGIEMKKRGVLFLPFGVRYGDVEVVYSTATVLGRNGDVLRLRNHLSGLSEVALRNVEDVRVVGGKIVDESLSDGVLTIVVEHRPGNFELEF